MDHIFHTMLPYFVSAIWALSPDMASAPISLLEPFISLYMPKKRIKLIRKLLKILKKGDNFYQGMDTITNYAAK